MTDWQPIETAKKDGSIIWLRIEGKPSYEFRASYGFDWNEHVGEYGTWYAVHEDEAPPCWDDGTFWAFNASGKPSLKPTHWKEAA